MYVPESLESMLARSDVAVVASINAVLYSGGVPLPPPTGPEGEPPPPGTLLPHQPDQIFGLTVLNVLVGSLPDGPLTVYKVNERYWIGDADIGQRWLFFLSRQGSGRWRTVVGFTPDAVDEVRAELLRLRPPEPERPLLQRAAPVRAATSAAAPIRPKPAKSGGVLASLRRSLGLD